MASIGSGINDQDLSSLSYLELARINIKILTELHWNEKYLAGARDEEERVKYSQEVAKFNEQHAKVKAAIRIKKKRGDEGISE